MLNQEPKQKVLELASKNVSVEQIAYITGISMTHVKTICELNYQANKKINDDRNKRSRLQIVKKVSIKRKGKSRIQSKDDTYLCQTNKPTKKPRLSQNPKKIRNLI
jgi:hypothetical protein